MTRRTLFITICIFILLSSMASCATTRPKNIILLISDGCGYNTITATNYFQYGTVGKQIYENFPVKFAVSTYPGSTSPKPLAAETKPDCGYDPTRAWSDFEYVKECYTDSAAAATAMACGVKTYNKAIGKDLYGNDLVNICKRVKQTGRSAGVATNVPWSHATPAAFVANNITRDNYADLATEMINSDMDVIMGAGHPYYTDDGVATTVPMLAKNQGGWIPAGYVGGINTWDDLRAGKAGIGKPWTLIETRAQLNALKTGKTPERVLATFQCATTLQQSRSGPTFHTTLPYEAVRNSNAPSLREISCAAINCLAGNPKGFFLMIEGGAVDWAAHTNQRGRIIEEQIDFNDGVESVVDWVEANSSWDETLLIVTADHETGYLTGPNSGPTKTPIITDIINKGKGTVPDMQFNYWEHTNSLIPIYAKGAGSEMFEGYATNFDSLRGKYIDNTDIYKVICRSIGLTP